MRNLVTGSQMKQIDRFTVERIGIPSMVLMERAAMAVAEETAKRAVLKTGRPDQIWAVCGTGNNGADGIAAARMLHLMGYQVTVMLCGDPDKGTQEYRRQLEIATTLKVPVMEYEDLIPGRCDVIIDGLFGVGLSRTVEGDWAAVIHMLESLHAREVIAIDIPSGIHSDTGAVMGVALQATVTVTFGYEKLGTVLYPGRAYSREVKVADIGFPPVSYRRSLLDGTGRRREFYTYGAEDTARLPERPARSHKGTFGRVLVVAGSNNMSGAAYLSALGAYRIGAGLVKIFTIEQNRTILQQQLPEAVLETYDPLHLSEEQIQDACDWAGVIVLGPGLGQEPYVEELVKEVLVHAYVPIIIDADGLNTIAAHEELTQYYTENIIITPHLGEMSRLTGKTIEQIKENPIETAAAYSSLHGITCVLKDAVTVVAEQEGQIYLNTSGSSAMAKAGTGDVLSGTVAGLLAQGEENWEGTVLGVYLHGAAGDRCLERLSSHGLLAAEIASELAAIKRR